MLTRTNLSRLGSWQVELGQSRRIASVDPTDVRGHRPTLRSIRPRRIGGAA